MRRLTITLLTALALPATAWAGSWSTVRLPARTGLNSVSCLSTRWCEAVGGWGRKLEVAHWNGRRWSVSTRIPNPRGASLVSISCRTTRSCVAVGQLFPREFAPINPVVERWNGRRWRVERPPRPEAARGDRGPNVTLTGVACPGARLCFAVGELVPAGGGSGPGQPLVERWHGRYWQVVLVPYGSSGLTSISCTSTRACSAVGAFEQEGAVLRWNGARWAPGGLTGLSAGNAGGLAGVACTTASTCLGVGTQENTTTDARQALAATGDGSSFTATPLDFPPSAQRGGSGPIQTQPTSVACAPTDSSFCAAVGGYVADNGAIGPLGAIWNGSSWTQVALRRGPVQLRSVSCPALGWCMAVGSDIAEAWR